MATVRGEKGVVVEILLTGTNVTPSLYISIQTIAVYHAVMSSSHPMTVHPSRFLVNKTNKCIEFQFYWYYDSTCFGQPFCPSSGVLSRCTAKNSWWWAERLPETCRVVIPIKFEFSTSVGFIHKVTVILLFLLAKCIYLCFLSWSLTP